MWNYGTHCQRIGNRDRAKKNVPVVVQYLYDLRFGSRFFGTVARHATYHYVLFPVTTLSLDFGESSTEMHATTYVRIHFQLLLLYLDFGESPLQYICPVSPLLDTTTTTYVYVQ